MRYSNWLATTAVGASLSLLSADAIAQLKASPNTEVGDRRETRRIPVIDANASATFRSSQLIGTSITDAEGRTIGKVVDFVSDARGNIRYPIVSYSGSAGFSGKLFAVPYSGLSFASGANGATTAQFSFDPQLLKNAPSFSTTRFPDFSDQAFVSELSEFYSDLLAAPATDPTVPANGPGDRVQTQAQAGTPRRPIDPTLPANGPGDRPATVNPALPRTGTQPAVSNPGSTIPGTTGTENAGFPRTIASTGGRTGSPAGSAIPGGTVVGRTGSPASESIPSARAGDSQFGASGTASGSASSNRRLLRSSQRIGMTVQGSDGKTFGKVLDFVGDDSGNTRFAVVAQSDGNGNIVLPYSALNFQAGANGSNFASLRLTAAQLQDAPSFTGDEWPDFSSEEFLTSFQDFYQPLFPDGRDDFDPHGRTNEPSTGISRSATGEGRTTSGEGRTTPGGSRSTPGGTRTPDWPSRPIPPSGTAPRTAPPTGKTAPGGSRAAPGGTKSPASPAAPASPASPGGTAPRPGGAGASRTGASGSVAGGGGAFVNPALLVMTSQGVMHKDAAARLGLEGTPLPTNGTVGGRTGSVAGGVGGFVNPDLLVMTSQGVMHKDAAARLGLEGTPLPKTSPDESRTTPEGTRTRDLVPRPIPPGGARPRLPAPGTKVPGIPGVPAVPATPAVPGGHGVPATPAIPASPAAPGGAGSGGGASAPGK